MGKTLGFAALTVSIGLMSQSAAAQTTQNPAVECYASLDAQPSLSPLKGKVPLGAPKASLEMQANATKPDFSEMEALVRWSAARDHCFELGKTWREANGFPRSLQSIVMQGKDDADALVSALYRGELTYGEFNVKRLALDAATSRRWEDAAEVARREGSPVRVGSVPQTIPAVPNQQQDRYQCEQDAARSYPAVMVQRMTDPGFQAQNTQRPIQTNCSRLGNQVVCQSGSTGADASIYNRPPSYVTEDVNLQNRQSAAHSCMLAKGYTPK